ncbi:hypothetical protein GCM10010347_18990 [Streptomyces cirratus]|uniref:DUF397 domain-containing protein n=1 Tax=Streptomyces cirratus TaxID=68187 RepID=A0ABQ3ETB8_9ACTN|nr:hypothetical protein GCM10010347_18990 [Streptomyces cirratus]
MTHALAWFKSSYSGSEGGNCLEVAYHWHKSSYSGDAGGRLRRGRRAPRRRARPGLQSERRAGPDRLPRHLDRLRLRRGKLTVPIDRVIQATPD